MSTSNRTALTKVRQDLADLDARLEASERAVTSQEAAWSIALARCYLSSAQGEINTALQSPVDPILDLTCGAPQ